jgi:transcriptional regulator with XRE-family HTH domain
MSETMARKRGRRGSPESWSVDTHVGQRVRMRRTLLGMSQEKLGEAIGLTFQQVQKYERGSNRISAGTLYRLSQVLDVPVSFFFDCYDDGEGSNRAARSGEGLSGDGGGVISRREARLLRLWRGAPQAVADEVLSLLSSLSADARESGEAAVVARPAAAAPVSVPAPSAPAPAPVPVRSTAVRGEPREPRESRADSARADAARADAARADSDGSRKPRRRHGAIWDPADIGRTSKGGPRE